MMYFHFIGILLLFKSFVKSSIYWTLSDPGTHRNGNEIPQLCFETENTCLSMESLQIDSEYASFQYSYEDKSVTRMNGVKNCSNSSISSMMENDGTFSVFETMDREELLYIASVTTCGGIYGENKIYVFETELKSYSVWKIASFYPSFEYDFHPFDVTNIILNIFSTKFFFCFAREDGSCSNYIDECETSTTSSVTSSDYVYLTFDEQENPYGFYEVSSRYSAIFFLLYLILPILTVIVLFFNCLFVLVWCCYSFNSEFCGTMDSQVEMVFANHSKLRKHQNMFSFLSTYFFSSATVFSSVVVGIPLFCCGCFWSFICFLVDIVSWVIFGIIACLLVLDVVDFWVFDFGGIFLIELLALKLAVGFVQSLVFNGNSVIELYFYYNDVIEDMLIFLIPFFELFALGGLDRAIRIIIFVGWILKIDNILYQYCPCVCLTTLCEPILDVRCCCIERIYAVIEKGGLGILEFLGFGGYWEFAFGGFKKVRDKLKSTPARFSDDDDEEDSKEETEMKDVKKKKKKKKKDTDSEDKLDGLFSYLDDDDSSDEGNDDDKPFLKSLFTIEKPTPIKLIFFISKKLVCGCFTTVCCTLPDLCFFLIRSVDILLLLCPLISLISWVIYLGALNSSPSPDAFVEEREMFFFLLLGVVSSALFASSVTNGISFLAELLLGQFLGRVVWGTLGIFFVLAFLVAETITLYLKVYNSATNPTSVNESRLQEEYLGNMLVSIIFTVFYLTFVPCVCVFAVLVAPCCCGIRIYKCIMATCSFDDDFPPLKIISLLFTNY